MNRQSKRNAIIRLLNPMRKHNYFKGFNMGNSLAHERRKMEIAFNHTIAGCVVILEAEFQKNAGRCDVLCLDCETIYEVIHSESEESISVKRKLYPESLKIVEVKV